MVDKIIKRTTEGGPLWEVIEKHHLRIREWDVPKTVCVVSGLMGCGKTTYLLNYFKDKRFFYFSFDGLEEGLAENSLQNASLQKQVLP